MTRRNGPLALCLLSTPACGNDDGQPGASENGTMTASDSGSTGSTGSTSSTSSATGSGTGSEPDVPSPFDCEPGSRPGRVGQTDGVMSEVVGVSVNVRTPGDYEPTSAYPLIVVYAPGGASADASENFTQLTPDATDAGFVIAYADSYIPGSVNTAMGMADIALEVANTWCIDSGRIYYTGDSGGGTTTVRVGASETGTLPASAILPVASGVNLEELESVPCPAPISVLVHHTTGDDVFPLDQGFGADMATWWAGCYRCDPDPTAIDDCISWSGCAGGVDVLYCEKPGQHGLWPANDQIIDFFSAH